jgi:hypothetical protein
MTFFKVFLNLKINNSVAYSERAEREKVNQ